MKAFRNCSIAAGMMVFLAAAQEPPSESVRPPDSRHVRTSVRGLLGWSAGVPSDAFKQLTFTEAAVKTDALGLPFIEGYDTQKTSPEIRKPFNSSLSESEAAAVKKKLAALKLKMPVYHAEHIGSDESSERKVLSFAKGIGANTVVCKCSAASITSLEKLANELDINIAVEAKDAKSAASLVSGRGAHIGVSADAAALGQVHDKLMVLTLRDQSSGTAEIRQLLLEIAKQEPPPEEQPDKCTNCSRPYGGTKPLFIAISPNGSGETSAALTSSIEGFEKDARPAMGYRVEQDSKLIPITSTARIPADVKQKIETSVPKQALAKPKKARKLLVIDICPTGAYYHDTAAHANLAVQLMAKNTKAFEPIFSNDLNNLKYPKIKSYDAVFLNSSDGPVFADPDVMAGLIRYVHEGGGLAGIHGASFASMDVPEFGELIGAADGPHHVEHAVVKIDDHNSPIMKGFTVDDFSYVDEFYHFLPTGPYSREKLHVLLSIDAGKSDLSMWHVRPDNDYGLVWVKSEGKGRVFNCALGHTPTLFQTPPLAEMILGGLQFVLGDLQVDTTPSAKL